MNILFSIHLYPPAHNCGAEYMAHHIAKDLTLRGHHVRILLHQANKYKITNNYVFDGIDVFPPNANVVENLFFWADCVFTHLDYTRWTIHTAKMYRKPVFHLIHNSHKYPEIVDAEKNQHIVYNSKWIKDELQYNFDNFILTPPVDISYYDCGVDNAKSEYITLINLNENKGGKIFEMIARAMPNKSFLGVLGSYDEQVCQKLDNLVIVENSSNIKQWYAKTRVLLMPSLYESWGRTATEAMANGIPVICSETPGLKENCDKAGIYVKRRENIKEWVEAITRLDDEKEYQKASRKAKARAKELDPKTKMGEFNDWLCEMVRKYK